MAETEAADDNSQVAEPSAEQAEMLQRMHPCLTLMGGTEAMREAGARYLPQEQRESPEAYAARLATSFLFNAYRHTVQTLVGKPFGKPVVFEGSMPDDMQGWADNIDLTGQNMTSFLAKVLEDAIVCSLTHIYVDRPFMAPGITLADERNQGIRPYWVHIKAAQVLGWRSQIWAGRQRLMQLRILEAFEQPTGKWSSTTLRQVRVIYAGDPRTGERARFEIWREVEGEKGQTLWVIPTPEQNNGNPTTGMLGTVDIPLVTIYTARTGFMMGDPPLIDLADLNIAHWQSDSDQRRILHTARVPILFGTGWAADENTGQPVAIGPNSFVLGPPNSTLGWVEHGGQAIASGRADLDSLEERMASMGAQAITMMKTGLGGPRTATEVASITAEVDASGGGWVERLQEAAQEAWDIACQYAGREPTGKVRVWTDWPLMLRDPNEPQAIIQVQSLGWITKEQGVREFQRRGILSDEFDAADMVETAEQEMPPPSNTPPLPGGGGGENEGGTQPAQQEAA